MLRILGDILKLFRDRQAVRLLARTQPHHYSTFVITVAAFFAALVIVVPINLLTNGSLVTGMIIIVLIFTTLVPFYTYQLVRLFSELEHAKDALYRASITDELTQAYNRRYFMQQLTNIPQQRSALYALVLLDLDEFKQINDTYGHAAGDAVLKQISQLCRAQSRASDVFARFGGEEFIFLLQQTNLDQAMLFAERIRHLIAQESIEYQGLHLHCTASIGVGLLEDPDTNPDHVIIAADHALYQAKHRGKNQVVLAGFA